MVFEKTAVAGALLICQQPFRDERGSFSRIYCQDEFYQNGIGVSFVQANICQNRMKATLRGLHTQSPGAEEDKLVLCTGGRIFDVCADVRPNSPTYGRYVGMELSAENGRMLFVPKGCAHGYLTLEDDCKLLYFMSAFYKPHCARGFRYDDPFFSIRWPLPGPYVMSEQDCAWDYITESANTKET